MSHIHLYVGNTHIVEVNGLQNQSTGAYINNAAIEFTLLTLGGVPVDGENWPVAVSYVAASNGNYLGQFSDAVALVAGEKYICKLTEVSGTIKSLFKDIVMAEDRRFDE